MATVNAPRDGNDVPAALFLVSGSNREVQPGQINSATGRVLVDTASGSGTVTSVSVVTANGFAGSVATATTTPAITLSTTITGLLKGNGTAISAAVSNTDYQAPITLTTTGTSGAATFNGTTLNIPNYTSAGTGDVVGPASASDNAIARFDTTTGKLIQNSAVLIADTTGVISGTQGVTFTGATSGTTALIPTAIAGTTTLTLPAATDTLIGKATTDTLTNKTYDTAGTGNSFSINGVAVTANQGTGSVVRATSPTLTTPVLGVATATSINGLIITTTTGTLTVTNAKTLSVSNTLTLAGTDGKTLTVSNSLTLAGTDATVMTFPTTSKTIAANDGSNWTIASQAIGDLAVASSTTAYSRLAAVAVGQVLVSAGTGTAPAYSANPQVTTIELGAATDTTISRVSAGVIAVEGVTVDTASNTLTLTNKRIQPRTASSTTASTLTPDLSSANVYFRTTQTATLTINAPIGTPVIGEVITIYVDSAGAQTLTIDATYVVFGAAFPASTTAGKTFMLQAQYNGTNWKTTWANAV
jgi:hypothetical protein